MKCKQVQDNFTNYLENSLSEVVNSETEKHLKNCKSCQQELEEMKSFLSVLATDEMETPSPNLKMNFDKMLAKEIAKTNTKVVQITPKQNWKSYLRVAASILIVVSAFLIGKYQSSPNKLANSIDNNQAEVLALLENNSASKRILAVTNAEDFSKKNTKILEALINRLFFDKNVNVRSAAAETLSKFSSEILVRDAFIKALETEKNSIVQIELIHILAKIQEKRAIKPMEKLLNNEETPQYVKQQLKLQLPNLL